MIKITAVTQARMNSSRLPGKVLKSINGISLLELHLRRIKKSKLVSDFIVATSDNPKDLPIAELGTKMGFTVYRGSEEDVLDRFYKAVKNDKPDYIVRLTADCPLIDAALIDKVIGFCIERNLDYGSNTLEPAYPDGEDVEVIRFSALEQAWLHANAVSEREHVTPYIWKNSTYKGMNLFKSGNFSEGGKNFGHLRMTVDDPADFDMVEQLIARAGTEKTWYEYAVLIENDINLRSMNSNSKRNEGYNKSLNQDNEAV